MGSPLTIDILGCRHPSLAIISTAAGRNLLIHGTASLLASKSAHDYLLRWATEWEIATKVDARCWEDQSRNPSRCVVSMLFSIISPNPRNVLDSNT